MKRIIFPIVLLLVLPSWAQETSVTDERYPDDAQQLYIMARNLWAPIELQARNFIDSSENDTMLSSLRQACLLLQAAAKLDPQNPQIANDLTTLLTSDPINDPSRAQKYYRIYRTLKRDDRAIMEDWISYRLGSFDDRETREYFLQTQLNTLKNAPFLQSKIMTQLGIFALEKGDSQIAASLFNQAYTTSSFNDDALARYLELPYSLPSSDSATPEEIDQYRQMLDQSRKIFSAIYWRLRIFKNPYDIEAVLNFIDAVENNGSYEFAQKYYPYAFELIKMEPGLSELEHEILFKQLLGAYSGKLYTVSLSIAKSMLTKDPGDLLVNALLVNSLRKLDQTAQAQQVANNAVKLTLEQLANSQPDYELERELAWFLCFIDPQPALALEHAININSAQSDDLRNKSILAYAFTLNADLDQAETLLKSSDPNDPVSIFAWVNIHAARGNPQSALQLLKKLPPARAGILADQLADKIASLEKEDVAANLIPSDAAPPTEQTPKTDFVVANLNQRFNNNDLLVARHPEKFIQCSLKLNKDIFNVGDPIISQLYLSNISDTNKTPISLILGPGCLVDPHVLILAETTARDQSTKTCILSHRYLMQNHILNAGRSTITSEILNIGYLNEIFSDLPQREFQITIRAIFDPIPDNSGGFVSKIPDIQPKPVIITRKAFLPTKEKLDFQLRLLRQGSPEERISATQLFCSLGREQNLAQKGQINYPLQKIDAGLIQKYIFANLNHSDFRVRAWSAYAWQSLPLTSPDEQAKLTELLTDPHWFVRFLTIQTLSRIADLTEFFDWAATIEENELIQRQIQYLLDQPWQTTSIPFEIPKPTQQSQPPAK